MSEWLLLTAVCIVGFLVYCYREQEKNWDIVKQALDVDTRDLASDKELESLREVYDVVPEEDVYGTTITGELSVAPIREDDGENPFLIHTIGRIPVVLHHDDVVKYLVTRSGVGDPNGPIVAKVVYYDGLFYVMTIDDYWVDNLKISVEEFLEGLHEEDDELDVIEHSKLL
ncbi:hypothetical protein [Vibrio mexicanus]|uniref:hypothetical protein n=1 Tax=Vibrio mexicanus TaxID=1004326 RepID=UPI00063C1338|nr:hypothetical protein [Vibrio mexicanus]